MAGEGSRRTTGVRLGEERSLTVWDAVDGELTEADADLIGFAELVAELAVSFLDEHRPGPQRTLVEHIVAGAVSVIPGTLAAAVETMSPAGILEAPVAENDVVARAVRQAQNAALQGPCLDALRNIKQVVVLDVARDDRWPGLAAAAASGGVKAIVCTPMEVDGRLVGALSLFSDADGYDDEVLTLARIFAAHAGVALTGARRIEDVNAALSSRDVIGQAKGILMERFKVTPDVAFAMLVRTSANTNTKLRAVCDELCRTGVLLRDPPRRPRPRPAAVPAGSSPPP